MPSVLNRGEVQAHLWGDLNDSERQLMFRRLRIKFENYRMGQYTTNWTLEAISLDSGKQWACTVAFDAGLLMQTSPSILNKVLVDSALQLAREMAPYLYAYDPRIGTPFSGVNGAPLRACPLFDRPDEAGARQERLLRKLYGTYFVGDPKIGSYTVAPVQDYDEYTKVAASLGGDIPHLCPFCQESLHVPLTGKAVAWGGGHIGWVHQDCVNDHQDDSF
jgi:hypothetical protein